MVSDLSLTEAFKDGGSQKSNPLFQAGMSICPSIRKPFSGLGVALLAARNSL